MRRGNSGRRLYLARNDDGEEWSASPHGPSQIALGISSQPSS